MSPEIKMRFLRRIEAKITEENGQLGDLGMSWGCGGIDVKRVSKVR